MSRRGYLVARYLFVASALLAAVYSFVLARAHWLFRQDSAASVPAAVKLVPFNSEYLARLAAWKTPEKVALLERAVTMNPFDFESWIQLGFASEFQLHDLAGAERCFLEAAAVNKMFLPKWTLTNYYFRHGNVAEFFRWASATLAITPYSPEPVFVQMWLMSQDAVKIAGAIPNRPRILLPYAWFLSNSGQSGSLAPVVQRLVKAAGSKNPQAWGRDDLLANIEDRLITGGDGRPALEIWANMVKAGWLSSDVPNAEHPITNGDFGTSFYRHGFDWRPARVDGVTIQQFPSRDQLRLQFSGDEPERCLLLAEYLPLQAGRTYRFRWQAKVDLGNTPSGLRWHLKPIGSNDGADAISPDLTEAGASGWTVKAPPSGLAQLTLEYARPLGSLRAQGIVTLRSVSATI